MIEAEICLQNLEFSFVAVWLASSQLVHQLIHCGICVANELACVGARVQNRVGVQRVWRIPLLDAVPAEKAG